MKTVQLDVTTLNMLAGVVIPLLVGLVTKISASSAVKAMTNAVLSAIGGGIAIALEAHGAVNLKTWIMSIGVTFITSAATYYGFWKPTTVAPTIQEKTRNVGIG